MIEVIVGIVAVAWGVIVVFVLTPSPIADKVWSILLKRQRDRKRWMEELEE